MDKIAAFMQEDKKYSAGELEGVIDVGKTRLREILSQMVEEGLIVSEGERKQRVYFVNKGKTNKLSWCRLEKQACQDWFPSFLVCAV